MIFGFRVIRRRGIMCIAMRVFSRVKVGLMFLIWCV